MSHLPLAPAEEALRKPQAVLQSKTQHQAPKLEIVSPTVSTLMLDIPALEQAARKSTWLHSQHQADAFVALAGDWLREGQPHLAPNPENRRVLDRFAAHHVTWKGALERAIAASPSEFDRECLQQVAEAMGFAARVGEDVSRRSGEQAQRTERIARLLTPESSAPFAYFKRTGPRAPLIQCRATDEGGVPLYLDPRADLDPVVVVPSPVKRFKTKVTQMRKAWTRCCVYVRQAAHNTWYPYTGDESTDRIG